MKLLRKQNETKIKTLNQVENFVFVKMVNIPMILPIPANRLFVTDANQNIDQEYYEWLLKQHNYFPDCAFPKVGRRFLSICLV